MTDDAKQALAASIAHWDRLDPVFNRNETTHGNDCALCTLYARNVKLFADACKGCPIYLATRKQHCEATPWKEANNAFWSARYTLAEHCPQAPEYARWLAAKAAMLNFLHCVEHTLTATREDGIYMECDGYYYFDPPDHKGSYTAHDLRRLADDIDKLNEAWNAHVNEAMTKSMDIVCNEPFTPSACAPLPTEPT